jgi:hypothetical protein
MKCVDTTGPTLKQLEWQIEQLDEGMSTDPDVRNAALIFTASLWAGPNETKIAEITKLSPEEIAIVGQRLRNSKVWMDDKICFDQDLDDDDPAQINTMMILCILCANGQAVRTTNVPSVDEPKS